MTLTARQQLVLDTIVRLTHELQRAPTVREIGAEFGIQPNAVMNHVRALRKAGRIRDGDGHAGVRIVVQDRCPICGSMP